MKNPDTLLFSIIVPVYNRPDEIADLLKSLEVQTDSGFEVVIVEDGSTQPCLNSEVGRDGALKVTGHDNIRIQYFRKENEGRSIARNYGMNRANGDYFVFVDSDCILPPEYIERLRDCLKVNPVDCFGGPDAAHDSFTPTQKAINFAMTAFLTTGGIRGGKVSMEKFTPRTFNMGFSKEVFDKVGGFREMSTCLRGFGLPDIRYLYIRTCMFITKDAAILPNSGDRCMCSECRELHFSSFTRAQ